MNEIRSVSVHLDAEVAAYIANIRLAGAETDRAFSSSARSIDTTNRSLARTDTEARKVDSSLTRVNQRLDQGGNQIDKYSGRLAVMGQALAVIGPGLVPIAAVGIPAALGMATALGSVAVGAVTTKVATEGLGAAVTALNRFALDPSATNLQAVHRAMALLPPDARDFARELAALRPELKDLQGAAASGLFPGLEVGVNRLQRDLPIVKGILHSTGTEVGHLAAEAGRSLSSGSWRDFLRFIEHDGPPSLDQVGRSLGHVTHGVAELVMAGAPLERGFLHEVLTGSVNFDHWASGAKDTQWFHDLIAYIDANGPRVEHFLGDTADLVINIVRAAAPLGGPVLNSLDAIARVLNAVVSSPAGPTILATVSALSVLSRGQALFGKVATSSWGQAIAGAEGYTAKISAARVPLTRGALALGGVAVAATGAASGLGLSNTAALALTGSLAGPWGAAVGAGVGLLMDFTNHQDNSAAATADFTSTLNAQTGAITDNTRAQVANVLQQDGAFAAAQKLGLSLADVTSAATGNQAAIERVNATLDLYEGKTQLAGVAGTTVFTPEQRKAAADLGLELGKVSGHLADDQHKTRQLASAMDDSSGAANRASKQHHRLELELAAEKAAAVQTASQFRKLGKDLDNSKVSLNGWIREMAHEADALINFGNNARRAADKGLRDGLIKQLEQMGPAGALRMRQLADATQSQIARANRAFDGYHRGAQNLIETNAYLSNHPPVLSVKGIPQSLAAIRTVQADLSSIRDKTVTLTVKHATGGRIQEQAEGGTILGQRQPYRDKVLLMAAPGEEVISNRYGQADKNRAALKAANRGARLAVINGPGMAGGGTVGAPAWTGVAPAATSRYVERVVERLPARMRLAVDGGELYAVMDGVAQGNYEANQQWERAQSGG